MPKSTRTESRYSVCIGINQYHPTAGLSTLRFAESDARAMDELLSQLGFEAENRSLLLGEVATLDAVNTALATILLDTAGENDLVVLYFAGHSLPLVINQREAEEQGAEQRSEVFLTTYDFDRQRIQQYPSFRKQHALGMVRLRNDYFEGEGSRKRLFIFDSCYSGEFFGQQYRDETDPVQGYIKRMLDSTSTGRVALSSCLPIQKAVEDPALDHGRFTYYLLKALSGEAIEALGRDGCLTVNGLFDYVAKQLPPEQRPVLSGVQQDTFELVCYPELAGPKHTSNLLSHDNTPAEKKARLYAMLADHSGFMRDRLQSFVGRQRELVEIRKHIAEKLQTGGYVTITGHAGQGKSSIIAKLIDEHGPENVAFHFIPINPGPDHQVGLLRNLMARLIMKYDLSDLYVASESRPALRDYFPKLLTELVTNGGKEVIFLDGLDQLEEDFSGVRDLSFLPNNPPPGIVFVLGTRPNDTLRPLELLKPHYEYRLPNLNRGDFDLILLRRQVQLERVLADQFYQAMQENALYLDLVAKELMEIGTTSPSEIIKRLANNPENLFSLSMARLKRQRIEWREVIKPILGLLLTAQEPLSVRHIRQILKVEDDRLREGIVRLGGLIVNDGQQRYTLFHLKLRDYLRQDEHNPQKEYIFAKDEEEGWHKTLADWCERGDLSSIWQDVISNQIEQERRVYARWHYITHLYYAQELQKLFGVLDAMQYGQEKIRFDPSIRPYAQDLDLGRQAAAWEKRELQEGVVFLPYLWRYTLLRCSLNNRAESYPSEVFEALVLLNRHQQALNLAELFTDTYHKAHTLLQIAEHLKKQSGREQECLQLLTRAYEVAIFIENDKLKAETLCELSCKLAQMRQWERAEAVIPTIRMSWEKAKALRELCVELARAQQWERAEAIVYSIEVSWEKAKALRELCVELARAQQWERAEAVMQMIEGGRERAKTLQDLGITLAKAQQWEQADKTWQQAMVEIHTIEEKEARSVTLLELILTLINERQWNRVEELIPFVEDARKRARALQELAVSLAKAQQWERAEAVIPTIRMSWEKAKALRELCVELARAQQWERAEAVMQMIEGGRERAKTLQDLGITLAKAQQWKQAEEKVHIIEESEIKARVLYTLVIELTRAQQWRRAKALWEQVVAVTNMIARSDIRTEVLQELAMALVTSQQWELAEGVACIITRSDIRTEVLQELAIALVTAQQWERANRVWTEVEAAIYKIEDSRTKAKALVGLGKALARAQQQKRADAIWAKVPSLIFTLEGTDLLTEALRQQVIVLAKAQQWELAEAVALAIDRSEAQDEALEELCRTMAKAQQWERAEAVVCLIKESNIRDRAVQELSTELVKAKQWERAEAVKRMFKKSTDKTDELLEFSGFTRLEARVPLRSEAIPKSVIAQEFKLGDESEFEKLLALGIELTKDQQWERAEAIWAEAEKEAWRITEIGGRNKALLELGTALAKLHQWEHAESVIRTIKESRILKKALRELGLELAKARQWEHAEAVANAIGNNEDKAEVLVAMVRTLEAAGEHTRTLHLIQRSWQRADTRVYTINLLSMVIGLFSLNPEIIPYFCESFTWVDTFLGG